MLWPAEFTPLSAISAFGKPWNRLSGVRFSWKITTTCLNLCEYVGGGGGVIVEPPPPPQADRPAIRAASPAIQSVVKVDGGRRGMNTTSVRLGRVCAVYNTAMHGKLRSSSGMCTRFRGSFNNDPVLAGYSPVRFTGKRGNSTVQGR